MACRLDDKMSTGHSRGFYVLRVAVIPVGAALLSCCSVPITNEVPATSTSADQAPNPFTVSHQALDVFSAPFAEPSGYGMYTYVLFGRRFEAQAPALPHDVLARYQSLLKAVASSTLNAKSAAHSVPKRVTNLFCVPVKSVESSSPADVANYSSDIGVSYLEFAEARVSGDENLTNDLITEPGPFLISSLQPLLLTKRADPLLLADLSTTDPAAMAEVVAAYDQRLDDRLLGRAQAFEPLRARLLKVGLDANKKVTLVTKALPEEPSPPNRVEYR